MQIVIHCDGSDHEVDLQLEDPHASVRDLLAGLPTARPEDGMVVDGRSFSSDVALTEVGLYEGAVVRVGSDRAASPREPAAVVLAVVDGPVAGDLHPLPAGETVVGRAAECDITIDDPTMSQRHARLERQADGTVVVHDLDSHNGTWVDGEGVLAAAPVAPEALVRLGATHVRVRSELPDDRPLAVDPLRRAHGGVVPFNRPPRPALPEAPKALRAPEPPAPPSKSRAFSVIAILAPLVMGAVLVVVFRNPRFAIFMLLSPMIAIGNWLSSRRQAKKEHRTSTREFRRALTAFEDGLHAAVREETARREQELPDLAETLRRAHLPSIQLWQRRPMHADFLRLRAGIGDVPWDPPLITPAPADELPEEVDEVVARYRVLPRAPVEVDLSAGGVVGLVGDRSAALALARSLVCQTAVHHGPADVGTVVLTSPDHAPDWDWAKWLPHVRDSGGVSRLLAGGREDADTLLGALLDAAARGDEGLRWTTAGAEEPTGRTLLYVLDDVSLTEGRRAPARQLLAGAGGPAAGIVIADTHDQLPAVTTTVVELVSDLGDATLRRPQQRLRIDGLVIAGLADDRARATARTLARYEDPELALVGAGLPQTVRLLPLLGMDDIDGDMVGARWRESLSDRGPNTPIGVSEDGVVHLDLAHDGPHGLIGGTTGSGKSELLRSMVAGMAARVDPDHLVFVLVDYKGGSAFDLCARLPHTVGLVTDLDEHLGERALTSLEAELAHRERLLRTAGAGDLPEYLKTGAPLGPLPRLVVVIDEFATLATELPDFLGALVGIAQRGRSLGVHLLLATQRPSGAVNANIKANTNLRIALRVQDAGDSTDIIDRKDAAVISRSDPGRAYVRLGPGDVLLVQTALSTAAASTQRATTVRLAPFRFGPTPAAPRQDGDTGDEGVTDLARLVEAVQDAFAATGAALPRRPWLDILPENLPLDDVLARAKDTHPVPFAIADEPAHQRQVPSGWKPEEGHLALFGMVGSGTTTALLSIARSIAERHSPDDYHLYALDFGAGGLAPLTALPHVGALIAANDAEGQHRLLRQLRRELERRRDLDGAALSTQARIVVLVDGIGAFLAEQAEPEAAELAESFRRVFSEGPGVRIAFAVTGDRVGEVPTKYSALTAQKLAFKLADSADYSTLGLRSRNLPAFVPGRAVDASSQLVVQVGVPGDLAACAERLRRRWPTSRPPAPVRALPSTVALSELGRQARCDGDLLHLPVGLADDDLSDVDLTLHATDHALVAGPPRSGITSALILLAEQVRAAEPDAVLIAICDERSPLHPVDVLDGAGSLQGLARYLRAGLDHQRRWVVLVDAAATVDDHDGVLGQVTRSGRPGLHVIAGGRAEDLRTGFSHWTRALRQNRTGILLRPSLADDGQVLGLRLPRRVAVPMVTGRGFVANAGELTLAQLALPDEDAMRHS